MNDIEGALDEFIPTYRQLVEEAEALAEALSSQGYESEALRFLVRDVLQLQVDQIVQILEMEERDDRARRRDDSCDCNGCTRQRRGRA